MFDFHAGKWLAPRDGPGAKREVLLAGLGGVGPLEHELGRGLDGGVAGVVQPHQQDVH